MIRIRTSPKNYNKYSLKRNPFPYVVVPDKPLTIFVNRRMEIKTLEEVLSGALSGISSHAALVGSYGNGKTAMLRLIEYEIEKQSEDVVAIYLASPGGSLLNLYNNFIYELGLDRMESFVWRYLELVNNTTDLMKKIENGEILITEIIEAGKRHLFKEIRYTDFATAFLKITLEETKFLSWKYLCAEPIVYDQRRELDVVTLIDTDEKALRAFMCLRKILKILGYRLVCLLIDEFEAVELLHPWKKQRVLNDIRRLIDLNPSGLCIMLACAPEAWNSIISEYHAFSERIFREVVLKPLERDDLRSLVVEHLNLARFDNPHPSSAVYPFTEEALDVIYKAAVGNIRRILMICNRAIDRGSEEGFPVLTVERIKKLLPEVFGVVP